MLYLYLIERLDQDGYDVMDGCVVAAESVPAARELASQYAGHEGAATWLRSTETTAKLIGTAEPTLVAKPTVLLTDVHAG